MSSTWEQVQRRLCLDHSQMSIEHSLSEIEEALGRWWNHPHQVNAFDKVLDTLFNVRWMLQLHLDGVTRLERDTLSLSDACTDQLLDRLKAWHKDLLFQLDGIIDAIRNRVADRNSIERTMAEFRIFRLAWNREEKREWGILMSAQGSSKAD